MRAAPLRSLCAHHAENLLDSLVNHEKTGVAVGAGTTGPAALDLGVMQNLLKALGNPHKGLPVVQIVGTKGKGSVATMLSAMLQYAGYKVGTYTSPHLIDLRERIAVNNTPISSADFDSLTAANLGKALDAMGAQKFSHFEMMTALAVKHFTSQKVDVAVMEAGLGGSHDATNVFDPEQVLTTVVTAIDVEHVEALGGTLQSIAQAKAGIIKPGCPVVMGHQIHSIAQEIICRRASELSCRLYKEQACLWPGPLTVGAHGASQTCRVFVLNGEMSEPTELSMQMVGAHQRRNAITAISAALALRRRGFLKMTVKTILGGLQAAKLPGRFQVGRLKDIGDDVDNSNSGAPWLVLDAAHTAASAAALAATLREAFPESRHRLAYVLAMAKEKDHSAVCAALRAANPVAVSFTTVPIANSDIRCAPPGALIASWQTAGFAESRPKRMRETIQASLTAAVMKAQAEVGGTPDGVVCVTGSVHAVAAALRQDLLQEG